MWIFNKEKAAWENLTRWLVKYTKHILSVNESVAFEAANTVLDEAGEASEPYITTEICKYGHKILIPLAYAMTISWGGRAGQAKFFQIASAFGIASLGSIAFLQTNELDEEYKVLYEKWLTSRGVRKDVAQREVCRSEGYLLWLAYVGAADMMNLVLVQLREERYPLSPSKLTTEEIALITPIVRNADALPRRLANRPCVKEWGNDLEKQITNEAQGIIGMHNRYLLNKWGDT